MSKNIDIQLQTALPPDITKKKLAEWVRLALEPEHSQYEVTLRIVNSSEIQTLNRTYRQQDKPTNVLAFPSTLPQEIMKFHPFLGDIIICPEVLNVESEAQHVSLTAHWAHIVIHGVLHLLGYDHITDHEAQEMQNLEILLLHKLGFNNPYHPEDISIE